MNSGKEKTISLWRGYNREFQELRKRDDHDQNKEYAHIKQDEIYRKFILDIAQGRFQNPQEIQAMAILLQKNVVNFDRPNHWWYA